MKTFLVFVTLVLTYAVPASAASVFPNRPDDPAAVYLTPDEFGVHGDGVADDTAAIQAAIDQAGGTFQGGIVLVPPGRYRLTRTIVVWRGVRVIGYGATRPVLVLGDDTPGFQKGVGLMVLFTHAGPRSVGDKRAPFSPPGIVPPNPAMPDANQGTFYSSMINVDVEIGDRNPAAVAIRFHVAQHGILSHMDFRTGSGLAALMDIGNAGQNLQFFGGRYGILTTNTSPFWPYTLVDSVFDGQRDAAIREHLASVTLIRPTFRNVPVAIDIDPGYPDRLFVKEGRFENISRAAVIISNERNPTTQIGVEDAVCSNVPVFAAFRESGRTQPGQGAIYRMRSFNHGLVIPGPGANGRIDSRHNVEPLAALPAPLPPAIRPLPPGSEWINVRSLGVKGDGKSDDTEAIRAAIASHRVLYFPSGYYVVRDTITLRPDTVLVALHPGTTQLDLPDETSGYQGAGSPKPLLEAPRGGTNIVSGLGLFTGGVNPRAVGLRWMAGEQSLVDDVHFHGFAGTYLPAELRSTFFKGTGNRSPYASGRWGAQYPSLWVTRGGGGTFHAVWTPNTFASSGFYVSDTTTPGHVYGLSAEHHLVTEIKLDRVENWSFYAPQTEEEASTSAEAVAFEINASKNITIANYHAYRVTRSYAPFPSAVRIYRSSEIRFRNVHVNAEHGYAVCDDNGCGTFLRAGKFAYENAIEDVTHGLEIRERELAVLDIPAQPSPPAAADSSGILAPNAAVARLHGGFHSISGAAVDGAGTLYFVDRHRQRIYSWSRERGLQIVSDAPLDPVNLAVDRSGALLALSSAGAEGTVYSLQPSAAGHEIAVIQRTDRDASADALWLLPAAVWTDGQFSNRLDLDTYQYTTLAQMFRRELTSPTRTAYLSPDGSVRLPAYRVFQQGPDGSYPGMDESGWRWSHSLDTYGFLAAAPGDRVYIASGAENRTYRGIAQADGTLRDIELFAERGTEGGAVDHAGRVYIANGQIYVFDRSGREIGRIDVPERPIQLVFGGPDRRTLFILTHRTLYGVEVKE
jgi:hypothetical protein